LSLTGQANPFYVRSQIRLWRNETYLLELTRYIHMKSDERILGDGDFTPTLQKPEGFRVKASEGEVVVLYFKPSATQNLKSSGFPEGETTWQNRPHPSNSPMEVSKNLSFCYDIGNNCRPLSNLCQVVYATKG
jgi:hypothetical protein